MRILFFSPDLTDYESAFYQRDFYQALSARHDVVLYGPGHDAYEPTDTIEDAIQRTGGTFEIVCLGHSWLRSDPQQPLRRDGGLDFSAVDVPTVMLLNKVYARFDEKVAYATEQEIDLVFTHHHNAEAWAQEYEPAFVFLPFAVNADDFKDYREPKRYDVTFSGILRNPNPDVPQSDVRKRIQDHMFHTAGDVWLYPKARYRDLDLFWSIRPTSKPVHALYKLLGRNRHLPAEEYKRLLNRSKIGLNSLSPMDLVGTRYYETMASKSLAFCQESPIYAEHGLFEPGEHCVTFAEDLSDFQEQLFYYLENEDERKRIAKRGYEHVHNHHTWSDRVATFTEAVAERLL